MPTAGDAFLTGQLPTQYNPLNRLNFNTPTLPIDPVKILTEFVTFLETYGLQALKQVTGIDFTVLKPLLDLFRTVVDVITGVAGGGDITILTAYFGNIPFLSDLLGGLQGNPAAGIPYTIPFAIPATPSPLQAALSDLMRMLGSPALGSGAFDPQTAISTLINLFFKPSNLLAWLVPNGSGGFVLPDILSPQLLLDLLNGVKGLLSSIGLSAVTDPIQNAINFLFGLVGISTSAQQSAVTATSIAVSNGVQLDAIAASGTAWSTNFDGAAGLSISPFALVLNLGFGAGGYQLDGAGHAVWSPGSGGITSFYAVPSVVTASDNQQASIVLFNKIPAGTSMWFPVRCSADGLNWVGAQASDTQVVLAYSVAGAITYFSGPVSYTSAPGEIWTMRAMGSSFTIRRNNVSLLSATSSVPHLGGAYRSPLFAATAPSGPFGFGQGSPAIIDSFAIGDIT